LDRLLGAHAERGHIRFTFTGRVIAIRNRVKASLRERAAAPQALEREDEAAAGAVARDRLVGVIGAGGIVLAGASEEGRQKNLVAANQGKQDAARDGARDRG
jgi:hypothetical protein